MAGNFSSVLNEVDTIRLHISVIELDASSRRGVEPCEQGWCSIHPYLANMKELRVQLGWYCADLTTSMKFGTDVDQNILNLC